MFMLDNFLQATFDKFINFYQDLSNSGRFAFFAIVALAILVMILIFMLIEQLHHSRKIVRRDFVQPTVKSEPKEEVETLDFDEENEKTKNLKEITQKIQAVIDNRNIDLTNFEQEQEEQSIISYNELIKAAGKEKAEADDEKFKLPDLARKIEENEIVDKKPSLLDESKQNRFKNSDFISPIYGIQNTDKPIIKSQNDHLKSEENFTEELDLSEIKKENGKYEPIEEESFLKNLKDFRNTLE